MALLNLKRKCKQGRGLARFIQLVIVAAVLGSQVACTAAQLPPYEATYTTKLRGIKITGTRKFESIGESQYKVSWKAKALWMRLNEWSEFTIREDGKLRPLNYHYTRKGLGTDRPIHIDFDWNTASAAASKGKQHYNLVLEKDTYDKLSYQLQMQIDLLENPNTQTLSYQVASHNRLKNYDFNFIRKEVVATSLGEMETLLFQRQSDDKTTNIWFSPKQYYLPVQIEQIEDGNNSLLRIKSWRSDNINPRGGALKMTSLNQSLLADSATNSDTDNTDASDKVETAEDFEDDDF